jgi:hypothetical protein
MLRHGLGARSAVGLGLGGIAPGGALWYLAGGAPLPIAAYQPKGAVDLAASYINLANPGTYNVAPGSAPTLGDSGWICVNKYLVTAANMPISGASARTLVGYMRLDETPAALIGAGVPSIGVDSLRANFSLLITSSRRLYGWITGTDLSSTLTLDVGVFYPVAFQFDGTNMRIRLGASTQSNTPTVNTTATVLRIPRDASGRMGKVTIAAAAVYADALTDTMWSGLSAAMAAL